MSAHLWPNTQADYVHPISECTSAACNQGRRQCPCPDACMRPAESTEPRWLRVLTPGRFWTLYAATLLWALVAVWLYFSWGAR